MKYFFDKRFYWLFFILSFLLVGRSFASEESLERTEYARIRIWETDLSKKRAGHVSLETSLNYLSVWPDTRAEQAVKILSVGDMGFSPVIYAPAINLGSYACDLEHEEDVAPTWEYIVGVDAASIDRQWRQYAVKDQTTAMDGFIWLVVSGANSLSAAIQNSLQANSCVNCASAVLKALSDGGIDTTAFILQQKLADHLSELSSVLSPSSGERFSELLEKVGMWGLYSSVTKPGDIQQFLSDHLKIKYRSRLVEYLRSGMLLLQDIPDYEREIALDKIIERFSPWYDEKVPPSLKEVGALSKQDFSDALTLKLNQDIVAAIHDAYQAQRRAQGALIVGGIGAAFGGAMDGGRGAAIGGAVGGMIGSKFK